MTAKEWQRKQLDDQMKLLDEFPMMGSSQLTTDIWNLKWMAASIGYQSRNYRMGCYSSLRRAIEKIEGD